MLTPGEQSWLQFCAKWLGVSTPQVAVRPGVHDIAYQNGTILLGRVFLENEPDSPLRRQKLLHETLHHKGWGHSNHERALSYHSRPERDTFTRELAEELTMSYDNPYWQKNPTLFLGVQTEPQVAIVGAALTALIILTIFSRRIS